MEDDFITLNEIFIQQPSLFKTKNLNSFLKKNNVQKSDYVKNLGLKKQWVQENLSLNLKLFDFNEQEFPDFKEVKIVLERFGCKKFDPVKFNLNSSHVKYFNYNGLRTPFFTKSGYLKIRMFFNDLPSTIFDWIFELVDGRLKSQKDQILDVISMVNLKHVPIFKNINGEMVFSDNIFKSRFVISGLFINSFKISFKLSILLK